jgi:hypothetical protein
MQKPILVVEHVFRILPGKGRKHTRKKESVVWTDFQETKETRRE